MLQAHNVGIATARGDTTPHRGTPAPSVAGSRSSQHTPSSHSRHASGADESGIPLSPLGSGGSLQPPTGRRGRSASQTSQAPSIRVTPEASGVEGDSSRHYEQIHPPRGTTESSSSGGHQSFYSGVENVLPPGTPPGTTGSSRMGGSRHERPPHVAIDMGDEPDPNHPHSSQGGSSNPPGTPLGTIGSSRTGGSRHEAPPHVAIDVGDEPDPNHPHSSQGGSTGHSGPPFNPKDPNTWPDHMNDKQLQLIADHRTNWSIRKTALIGGAGYAASIYAPKLLPGTSSTFDYPGANSTTHSLNNRRFAPPDSEMGAGFVNGLGKRFNDGSGYPNYMADVKPVGATYDPPNGGLSAEEIAQLGQPKDAIYITPTPTGPTPSRGREWRG